MKVLQKYYKTQKMDFLIGNQLRKHSFLAERLWTSFGVARLPPSPYAYKNFFRNFHGRKQFEHWIKVEIGFKNTSGFKLFSFIALTFLDIC